MPSLEALRGSLTFSVVSLPASLVPTESRVRMAYGTGLVIPTKNQVLPAAGSESTRSREVEDWPKLLGDVVVVTPLLDRLMHHGQLVKFAG